MDTLLYFFARALVAMIQALPLRLVARIGRALAARWRFGSTRGIAASRCKI